MPFGYACDRCRQKHQSCDHQFPCQRCIKANSEDACHYTPKRPRSRKGSSSCNANAYSVVVNSGFLGVAAAGGVDSNSGGLCLLGNGTTTNSLLGANNSLLSSSSSNPNSQQQHIHQFQSSLQHHHHHINYPQPPPTSSNNVHHQSSSSFNSGQNSLFQHHHQRTNAHSSSSAAVQHQQQHHSNSLPPHPLHLHHQHHHRSSQHQHRMSTGSWSGEGAAANSSSGAQMIYLPGGGFPLVGGASVPQSTARTSSPDSVYSNDILLLENELFSREIHLNHSSSIGTTNGAGMSNSIYGCNSVGGRNASVPACFPSSELLDGIHYSTSKLYETIPEPYARYYGYDSSALLASGVFMQEYMREAINFINDDIRLAEGNVSCGIGSGLATAVIGGSGGTILSPSSVVTSSLNDEGTNATGANEASAATVESGGGGIFGELTSASNGGGGSAIDDDDNEMVAVVGRGEQIGDDFVIVGDCKSKTSSSSSFGQNIPPNGSSCTNKQLTMIGKGDGNSLCELRSSSSGVSSNSTSLSHL